MKIIQRGNLTVILNPDEDTCDEFEDIMFAGVAGFKSVDAILQDQKAESQPQPPAEPPQNPEHA
jgi:hypothetical protein